MIPKKLINRTLNRFYSAHQASFQIKLFREGNNVSPNVYKERVGKDYGKPIECLGYIETELTELRLQELGWHKDIPEIAITVPISTLEEHGLIESNEREPFKIKITLDDLLVVPGLDIQYKISQMKLVEPFIDNKPTYVCFGGRKYTSGY